MTDGPPSFASTAERDRYWAGRHDWQDDRWEDHCGDPRCDHPCCGDSYIPSSTPRPVPPSFGLTAGLAP